MFTKTRIAATAAAMMLAAPVFADGIRVEDPYARVSAMMSSSGAAFMMIHNETGQADHLIDAKSDIAKKVELHTHIENADGVMQMIHVEEGFELPEGGLIAMQRGGHHVMFMGLNQQLEHGDTVNVTLVFKNAGDVAVEIPVDLKRKPKHGMMNHGEMKMNGGQMSSD
ncbi:copper chaperone PCu(A)C [Alisedimentitalea sp. MJ-SS2]|uniref:copper chaperone PCu(A)C n=1 Tax=Aliisedimentitalea sp. MJ-SS2 TaxID=3049795 RepID=UPI002910214F|nr:copper chaperone PCu(A)C [Alisedimentitalea sp. MJ-SS2]MDU8929873.1 copper chaperone PCu(A)C [Alisedimentitalea sp. MJ-SS2]